MSTSTITVVQSNAFVETCEVLPTGSGSLDGLCFAVKDLIDVASWKTGCGNPRWRDTHPPAVVHAICVEQLLRAGGRCFGKTITDELAFSLLGQNHFYGTPLNPRSPDRVPGGSSSGSASAVACGLVDFALNLSTWLDTYCVLQWAEIKSCLGAWIADAKPEFGPATAASFDLTSQLDRQRIAEAVERREWYYRHLHSLLGPRDLLCMPTAPSLAPRKGDAPPRSSRGSGYYPRALALTSVAGIGRLPQVSLPLSHCEDVPVGLSLLTGHGHDAFLLDVVQGLF